ncbi:hypothetical protein J2X54_003300 [Duganella sp. 3397]|uniref:hypothetical protein n=1 Tax=Duganella sp. 3397 TaxID=2817732 RepID=UPI0028613073|nr:hypothetical protein [Duganella sp. 3397]MDR7050813.1 hypothetical protein [Duganella sp. 3397]
MDSNRAAFESVDKLLSARTADADALEQQLQVQRDANAVIGLTKEQAAAYNRTLVEEAAVRKEIEASILDTIAGRERLQSYGDMAGAAAGFFGEQSKGYKVLTTVSQVFHAAELAMTLAELVPKGIAPSTHAPAPSTRRMPD